MQLKRVYTLALVSGALLSPVALLAQNDSYPLSPVQSPQPMAQQVHPTAHPMPERASDSNATPGLTGQEMKDKMFIRKSTEGGIAEVKLGQLAADKGSAEDVKSFGNKMVTDHTQLTTDMKPVADSLGIRMPKDMSKDDKVKYDKLAALSGDEFDKAFILAMLDDHRKDWKAFHEEGMATNDPMLKAEVDKGELLIRDHMRMAIKMAKDRNILPTRPPGPPPAAPAQ